MKWSLTLLAAILSVSSVSTETEVKVNNTCIVENPKVLENEFAIIPDDATKLNTEIEAPLLNNTRQGRQLRRFKLLQYLRLNAAAGRVAADSKDDLENEPEALERAVRRRQRVRRRNTLGITPGSRKSSKRSDSSKSKSKGSKKRKNLKSGSKKRNSSLRRRNDKRKSSKAKKPNKKTQKQPIDESEITNDDLNNDDVNNDDVFDEEIHKLQRGQGEPISVMIVEEDY